MLGLINKLLANDKMRYLIAGGCTTFVNFITFFVLRVFTEFNRNTCNAIAIAMAITFAYFANKIFVFESRRLGFWATFTEALSFVGARLVSMVVELLGFAILCDSFRISELFSKIFVQFVVLVLNYVFSRLLVFNKKRRSVHEHFADNYCYYISFGIVSVILLSVFVAENITPFGGNTLTIVDSLHQYLPFFSEYREKLINEGSLFYSWNIALGSNFMSLSAYYLSSPFNYLLILFGKDNIAAGVCIIMAIKIALTSVSMAYYLGHRNGEKERKNFLIIAVSVCYALSNYVIGYYWNTMWLDCIMVFPLVILGFERLMKEGNPRLYAFAMFYTLFCNYYIGFIVCLFMVLWFIVYSHGGVKNFFVHGIRFAVYSLISGGMAAFLLVPAYFGIMSTASAKADIPKWKWYGDIFVMLKQQLFLTEPITNQTFDGGVNLYCGMLAVFALVLYIFAGRIKLTEKLGKLILLAFLTVSFNSETLNFIWHGMHDQYGIPNRFSFLYIFILLVILYDVLDNIGNMQVPYVIAGAFLAMAFVLMCRLKDKTVTTLILSASLIMLIVYAVLCCLRAGGKMKKKVFNFVIGIICIIEVSINAIFGFMMNGSANYDNYYSTTPDVRAAYSTVKELADEDGAGFYRAELMDSTVLDEATWHNMPSVGTFCSTVLGEVVTTMGRIGFYTGANEFLYMGSTPFTNSIFNVRYLLKREGDLNNFDYEYRTAVNNVEIYENPYPLSIGFCVSADVKEWNRDMGLPLDCQQNLAHDMTGCDDYFTGVTPPLVVSSETCSTQISGNTIKYTPYEAGDASIMVSFSAEQAGDYYVNCRGNGINKIRFYVNGKELSSDRYQIQIFHLGELEEGDYVSIEYCYKSLSVKEATASLYMSIYDEDKYRLHYERLRDNMLEVLDYDDGYIYGEVDMPEEETLFTSVPYDKGWSVLVDGKKSSYYAVGKAFIGIDMPPGHHTVEMIFTPYGLYQGIIISAVSWLMLMLGVMHNTHKKRNKKLVKNDNNEIDREMNI